MTVPTLNGTPTLFQPGYAAGGSRAITHTVPGGLTSSALIAGIGWSDPGTQAPTGWTWGAQSFTLIGTVAEVAGAGGEHVGVAFYCLVNPTAATGGTSTISASSGAFFGSGLYCEGFLANFENVDQVTPTENYTSNTSSADQTSMSLPVTSGSNNVAIGGVIVNENSSFTNTNGTSFGTLNNMPDFINTRLIAVYLASVNPTFTFTKLSSPAVGGNAKAGFSLRGTGGGGGTSILRQMMQLHG